jgi:hypothetical protein
MISRIALVLGVVPAVFFGAACDKKAEPPTVATTVATPVAPLAPPPAAPAAPAAPPAASAWVTYVQPQKLFSARFPAKPEESENKADTAIGPITLKMAMSSHPSGKAYAAMASVYELPKGTTFDIQKALDGARDGMIGKINGAKITSEKPSKLDGYDGRELIFEGPGPGGKTMKGQARIYASADPPAAYMAFVVNVTGGADEDATPFLDSLHVGKGTDAK